MPTPENYYDAISSGYDSLHGEEQLRKARLVAGRLKLTATSRVLDVGGGSGLASEVIAGKHTVLDPSAKLLEGAAARGLTTIQGTAEKLPFPDHSFDAVISLTAIHHFTRPETALNEMLRVSKGPIVVSLLRKAKRFSELDKLIRKTLAGCLVEEDQHDFIYFYQK